MSSVTLSSISFSCEHYQLGSRYDEGEGLTWQDKSEAVKYYLFVAERRDSFYTKKTVAQIQEASIIGNGMVKEYAMNRGK